MPNVPDGSTGAAAGGVGYDASEEMTVPDIQHAIQIEGPPESVYPLIARADGFAQWWAEDITESRDAVELGFFKRATVYRLRLKADRAPAHANWVCETGDEWNGTHIVFDLEGRGSRTLLRFAHRGWRSETEYFTSCNTTWGELMFRLKAAAEGKPRGPLFRAAELAY
jgi:hypothetical protein